MSKYTDDLKNSPIFALSLCSKELAHSNFWAWLMEIEVNGEHPFSSLFLDNDDKFEEVKREEEHRDLTICYTDVKGNKKCCFVENKIKSIPTEEQLERYTGEYIYSDYPTNSKRRKKEYELDEKSFLTGIEDTLGCPYNCKLFSTSYHWEFMSYEDIAKKIEEINEANNSTCYSFYYETIKNYVNDLKNISSILKEELESYEDKYCCVAEDDLKDIKLDDIFLKLKGEKVAKYFSNQISTTTPSLGSCWGFPEIETSFNNKKETISIIYKEKKKGKEIGRIGVQLEGNQFRIYGGPSDSDSSLKNEGKLVHAFLRKKWFEKWKKGNDFRGHNTSMNGRNTVSGCSYNKYVTSTYTHLYQYWDINDGMDLNTLWEKIKKELSAAKIIIDSGFSFK